MENTYVQVRAGHYLRNPVLGSQVDTHHWEIKFTNGDIYLIIQDFENIRIKSQIEFILQFLKEKGYELAYHTIETTTGDAPQIMNIDVYPFNYGESQIASKAYAVKLIYIRGSIPTHLVKYMAGSIPAGKDNKPTASELDYHYIEMIQ